MNGQSGLRNVHRSEKRARLAVIRPFARINNIQAQPTVGDSE